MSNKSTILSFLKTIAAFTVLAALTIPIINSLNKQTSSDKARFFDPGIAAYQLGHYAEAEKDMRRYLAVYPDTSNPLYNLGLCELAQGRKAEARSSFQASEANCGQKMGRSKCGGQPCDDLAEEMLAWMDQNPNWDASQTASIPPFPSAP